eukprot:TRINITY_DN113_c0_g3_i1.p1 TRINITY_DN113_c0_g3~~TRINITY_DN113_c0_g3_i1.p1  ORF type:complete len:214 (-),score=47.61 TRINITY_DN113_c0_g3_i1:110-685(-)
MFIVDWFWGALYALGLWQKKAKILFLGLDNAGKTTLLQMLKDDRLKIHYPTFHPNTEELTLGSIKFTTYDLGGHTQARKIWNEYFTTADAIVFLVDCADRERLLESKEELNGLLSNDVLAKIPFLVLGNKIDLPEACSEEDLRGNLGLIHTTGKGNVSSTDANFRPIEVFMCSVVQRQGYGEGFKWIAQYL